MSERPRGHRNSTGASERAFAALVHGFPRVSAIGSGMTCASCSATSSYSVSRRTREIGVRVALGAQRRDVVRMVLREGMGLAVIGVGLGVVLAAGATRLIAGLLFAVDPLDAATFAGMSTLFIGVAMLASYLPARRAARSDPLTALRSD